MANVKIVTDSSCTISSEIVQELDIHIIALSVMIDDVIYDDSLSGDEFMRMMAEARALPKTSQPPIGKFVELYDELGKDGSPVISIHMTEALSGTFNTAKQAAQISESDVTVIDSTFTDQGLSFQAIRAAELAKQGADKDTIIAAIDEVRRNSKLFIGVASLDNLVKGGRVNRVVGMLSNFLNVKVVMQLVDGKLVVQAKGRGIRTFNRWFDDLLAELKTTPNVKQIGISHAGASELCEQFREKLLTIFPDMHIPIFQTNPIVATHAGKGAFAVMFYTE